MIAVIFEVLPAPGMKKNYLAIAQEIRPLLDEIDGFISVERFQSLTNPNKLLSLSFFDSEEAVHQWREMQAHRDAQHQGRAGIFSDYRLRVAGVLRDYGLHSRDQAPVTIAFRNFQKNSRWLCSIIAINRCTDYAVCLAVSAQPPAMVNRLPPPILNRRCATGR